MNATQKILKALNENGDPLNIKEITQITKLSEPFVRQIITVLYDSQVVGRKHSDGRLVYWPATNAPIIKEEVRKRPEEESLEPVDSDTLVKFMKRLSQSQWSHEANQGEDRTLPRTVIDVFWLLEQAATGSEVEDTQLLTRKRNLVRYRAKVDNLLMTLDAIINQPRLWSVEHGVVFIAKTIRVEEMRQLVNDARKHN